jgi:hypothetical protein
VPTAPEQVAQLRHAERDLSAASLVLLASQNGQHRVGQHSQCDVPIPALPVANFVVIQSAYELLQMREQRIGAILNNSSISGLVGIDGRAMYHAGKHGALKTNPVTDRTYPMNLSEDFLSLGGNQLLYLCSCSLIFAVAKAPPWPL